MKFERNSDVKEVLKIGRYANSLTVDCLMVKFECMVSDDDYTFGEMPIEGLQLIPLLRHLERDGLDYQFHQMLTRLSKSRINQYEIDCKYKKKMEITGTVFRHDSSSESEYSIVLIPDMFGKDVLYMNKLYRIKDDPNF